mmetsp:Transcript_86559/g.197567  ORF Transcript_86559/g.197567 Transcript_86559/m.197567 type:complete len:210 (-) Transcript_86559:1933-2562(-)
MGLLRFHSFHDPVQHGHPTRAQMAILQHDPRTSPHPFVDHSLRAGALALPERNTLNVLGSLRGELIQGLERIGTRRQHKDQRGSARRIRVGPRQIKRRRRNKFLPELLRHVVMHRRDQPVGPEAPQYKQALKGRQGNDHLGPLFRVGQDGHGGGGVVGRPPPGQLVLDRLVDPGEGTTDQGQAEQLRPSLWLNPISGLGGGVFHGHSSG